ncbi:HAD family hydrolase [Streptomyces sp. 4F14]|uniref:HAD family hydrolase n=1 Tax=Streptomyces sp. 4F14 TaxID=3394380 RepID=UPI003A89C1A7
MNHHVQGTVPGPGAAVVLDCDGLLVTTEKAWDLAYDAVFAQYGVALTQADRDRLRGRDLTAVGRFLAERLRRPACASALAARALGLMRSHVDEVIAPMPGAVELVAELTGARPVAVASNAPADVVEAHLRRFFDLSDIVVIGGDMVAAPKPQPDVYLAACAALASDPAGTWALEDSATGAAAAVAAGLCVIGVPHRAASGFPCHLSVGSLDDPRLREALLGEGGAGVPDAC